LVGGDSAFAIVVAVAVRDKNKSMMIAVKASIDGDLASFALAISDRTVKRDWAMAKAWMQRELRRRVQGDRANSDGGTI
jgi:hypothetical protein